MRPGTSLGYTGVGLFSAYPVMRMQGRWTALTASKALYWVYMTCDITYTYLFRGSLVMKYCHAANVTIIDTVSVAPRSCFQARIVLI
jgi:hypothetical protein